MSDGVWCDAGLATPPRGHADRALHDIHVWAASGDASHDIWGATRRTDAAPTDAVPHMPGNITVAIAAPSTDPTQPDRWTIDVRVLDGAAPGGAILTHAPATATPPLHALLYGAPRDEDPQPAVTGIAIVGQHPTRYSRHPVERHGLQIATDHGDPDLMGIIDAALTRQARPDDAPDNDQESTLLTALTDIVAEYRAVYRGPAPHTSERALIERLEGIIATHTEESTP